MRDWRLTGAALLWAFAAFWLLLGPTPPPMRLAGLMMVWPLARAVVSLLLAGAAEKLRRPQIVYYLRDSRGYLLYVGQTIQPFKDRLNQHLRHDDDVALPWRHLISPEHSAPVRRCLTEAGLDVSERYRIRTLALAGRMRLAPPIRNNVFNQEGSRKAHSPLRVVHLLMESAVDPPARWHGGVGGDQPEETAPAPATADAVSLAWAEVPLVESSAPVTGDSGAVSFEQMMAEEFPDGLGVVADGPNVAGWDHHGRLTPMETPEGGSPVSDVAPETGVPGETVPGPVQFTPPPHQGSTGRSAEGPDDEPFPLRAGPASEPVSDVAGAGSDGAVVRRPGGSKSCECGAVAVRGPRCEDCHKLWQRERRKKYPRKGKES